MTVLAETPVPGLVYVDDRAPGYGRRRCGRGFVYHDVDGAPLRDPETVARLRGLVVPPAWTDVWFCVDPAGHIQATGRDAKGRKQYRYHAEWQRARGEAKFESLVDFGHALPILRDRVDTDMRRRDLSLDRVVAATVWLLDRTMIRVGNAEYATDSYGLTTLLDEHVDVSPATLHFRFVGKSGKPHDVVLSDRRVARIVRQCQELPGQQLLQYVVGDTIRGIGSRDVNDYIREVTHTDFTAKTFRTWGGSVYALGQLLELGPPSSDTQAKLQTREAIKATAAVLRNTATVCRQSYVHPAVLEAHADGSLHRLPAPKAHEGSRMSADEVRLMSLLEAGSQQVRSAT
jgi:DNA topoisomerase-1